jgi:hypothetical protein
MYVMFVPHRKKPMSFHGLLRGGLHGCDYEEEEEREVGSNERHYGWGGTEYIIGFEGSQALPVCPSSKCKLLTGLYFFICR